MTSGITPCGRHSTRTVIGHGSLEAIQCLFILTQVVGHVPVSVDCKELCASTRKIDKPLASCFQSSSCSKSPQSPSPEALRLGLS